MLPVEFLSEAIERATVAGVGDDDVAVTAYPVYPETGEPEEFTLRQCRILHAAVLR